MKDKAYKIHRIPEFRSWYDEQTEKSKVQIDDRLSKIQNDGYFGYQKFVGDDNEEIWELKWKNGRRIYYVHIPEKKILVLLGGNKNGQNKDIHQAKSLCKKYTS